MNDRPYITDELRRLRRERPRRPNRRRRLPFVVLAAVALVAAAALFGRELGDDAAAPGEAGEKPARASPPELPRGGRTIFPRYRVVAFYGAPQSDELGVLGIGTPRQAARKLLRQARPYRRRARPVLPAFELIATIAAQSPGAGGDYSERLPDRVIRRYLAAARRARALLVLDIQPGHADFMQQARAYRRYLEQPDVGLALDPEWSLPKGARPASQIGSTSAGKVNQVSAYLADLVRRRQLPQKLLVVHQFTDDMVKRKERIKRRPEVALTLNVDGFGARANKLSKYRLFQRRGERHFRGFKLFYREDTDLMAPAEVLRLRPPPDFVVYE